MTKKLLAVAISAALMGSVGFTNTAYADEGAHSFPSQCWHPSKNVLKSSAYNHPGVCDEAIAHWESEHQGETSSGEEDGEVEDGEVEDSEVEDGEVEDGEVEDGEVEDGEVEDGEVEDSEVEDGETEDGEVEDSEVEDGEVEDGEVEDGESEEGEVEDGEVEDSEVEDGESEEGESEEGESEVETEIEVTVEQVVANIVETQLSAEETIQALNEAGLTLADLSEEQQQQLSITDDPVAIVEQAEESAEEGVVEESEANTEETQDGEPEVDETQDGEPEVDETQDGEPEVDETQDGEPEVDETQDGEPEVDETQDGEPEAQETEEGSNEIPTEPLAPEDVEENTYSMGLTDEEQTVIETQLEVVEQVIVGIDEEGNEITAPVEDTQVIGEVVIPSEDPVENAEDDGVNAVLFGEPVNVAAEFGVAEATVIDGETQILTSVTGVEIVGEASEEVQVENIDTENTINLYYNESGNAMLTIPNLDIGGLTVNVELQAITDDLFVYQVKEVTVAAEDVFVPEDGADPETELTTPDENVEPEPEVAPESEPAPETAPESELAPETAPESEPAPEENAEPAPEPENAEV